MAERTENEKAAASFDTELTSILKRAKKRSEQVWPRVINQLEMAQYAVRDMMHPDDRG